MRRGGWSRAEDWWGEKSGTPKKNQRFTGRGGGGGTKKKTMGGLLVTLKGGGGSGGDPPKGE